MDDVLGEDRDDLAHQIAVFRRYARSFFVCLLALLTLFSAAALLIPAEYRSTATILIEQQQIPQDLVRSTVTGFAEQRIQVIAQRVMTSGNLMEIIKRHDLYARERRYEPRERILERMRDDIELSSISADVVDPRSARAMSATIAFTLGYRNRNSPVAFRVANELTSLFISENLKSRTQMAEDTSRFLDEEANRLQLKVDDLEQQLADYRGENFDRLPEFSQTNLQLLDRADREHAQVVADIDALNEKVVMLESRIAQSVNDQRFAGDNPRGFLLTPDQQRFALASELARALTLYTENHPSVKRLRRELLALDSESASVRETNGAGVALEGAVRNALDSSVIGLQASLDSARLERDARRERLATLEALREDYRQRLNSSPEVEGRYRVLTRDYETAATKLNEIKAKLLEADLAQALEVERKAERFTLIDPPMRPQEPVWPNRPLLLTLGAILAVAGSLVFIFVRSHLDRAVYGLPQTRALLGAVPIMTVPAIVTDGDRRRQRRRQIGWSGGVAAAVLALAATVHFAVTPLGTLWLIGMRRLGL